VLKLVPELTEDLGVRLPMVMYNETNFYHTRTHKTEQNN